MKPHYYFDNAATSFPKPESVYVFMDNYSRTSAVNPGRAGYSLAIDAQIMVDRTREMLKAFFNFKGDHNRVVFTQNLTDSLNTALFGLLSAGDHVITTQSEHNSVLRPLHLLAGLKDVSTSFMPLDSQGYVDPDDLRKAILPNTKAIVINHASNVLGSVQDLKTIGSIAKQAGVIFIVDSAQTAGAYPVDMTEAGIDILAFTGHKGLLGPMGVGGLIVSPEVDLAPARVGGTGIDSIEIDQPAAYPHRLEAGTLALPAIAGLYAAQHWFAGTPVTDPAQVLEKPKLDMNEHFLKCHEKVQSIDIKERTFTHKIIEAVADTKNIKVLGPTAKASPRVATLSLLIRNMPSDRVGEQLDADYHICVRSGLHCAPRLHQQFETLASNGTVRISPGYFTTDNDVDHLIRALLAIAE